MVKALINRRSVLPCYMHNVFSIDMPFLHHRNHFIMETHARGGKLCTWLSRVSRHLDADYRRARLSCQTEDSNTFDPCVVVIRKNVNVSGHVPRKISIFIFIFIQRIIIDSNIGEIYTWRFGNDSPNLVFRQNLLSYGTQVKSP